jgi:C_GCAxxG_C_C family probable redox protein
METKGDIAVGKFLEGYNCAQVVIYSFCDDLGFDRHMALRLACGFGGGMARKQEVCGAISGGILAIGFKHGRGEGQDRAATEVTYGKVRELMSRFESRHGTCNCRALLGGCNLDTPEGHRQFMEGGLRSKVCVTCVRTVVEALEDIL